MKNLILILALGVTLVACGDADTTEVVGPAGAPGANGENAVAVVQSIKLDVSRKCNQVTDTLYAKRLGNNVLLFNGVLPGTSSGCGELSVTNRNTIQVLNSLRNDTYVIDEHTYLYLEGEGIQTVLYKIVMP